ncbi:MAG: MFS transporter [Nitriliruptoraceae bacterium]
MTASWFVRICLWMALMTTGLFAVRPMVSYRAIELQATTAQIGFIAAAFGLVSLFIAIPVGRWVDRVGPVPFLVFGSVVMAGSGFWLITADSLWILFASQALLGSGQICGMIGVQVLVANSGAPGERDALFGMFAVAGSVGQIIGPALGGWVASMAGGSVQRAFLVSALVMVVLVLTALTYLRWPAPERSRADPNPSRPEAILRAIGSIMRIRSMPQAMLSGMTVLAVIDLLVAYLPVYGEANGLSVATVGVLLAVRAATSTLSRLAMVVLIRRFGRRHVFIGSLLLPAVAMFALPVLPHVPILMVLMALAGFGLGLGQPMSASWVAGAAPVPLRGTAMGVRLTGNRAGQALIPILAGGIGGVAGISAIFLALGVMLSASAAAIVTTEFADTET